MKEVTKEDIYKAFQNVDQLTQMFGQSSGRLSINSLMFERVTGNSTDPSDEDVQSDARFCVWKCSNIHIKLTGYITSYGNRTLERWDFVEPKEKVVLVYE